jgi:hypothetical protein
MNQLYIHQKVPIANASTREVREIEELSWVVYFLLFPLTLKDFLK